MFTLLNLMDAMENYNNGQDNIVFVDMEDNDDIDNEHNTKEHTYSSSQDWNYVYNEIAEWHLERHDEYTCVMYKIK